MHIANVVIMFFNFYRNFAFTGFSIEKFNIDHLVSVPFHYEDEKSDNLLPNYLIKSF